MKHDVTFRNATFEDLELLKHWDEQPHVKQSDPDSDWEWESELKYDPEWRQQLIAEVDGKPIGFLQIIDPYLEETHYWGNIEPNQRAIDIWIGEVDYLNKGFGTQMMQMALQKCFENQEVTRVVIDPLESNKAAHRFYERIGYQFVENRYFDNDYCKVYEMRREVWMNNL